MKSHKANKKVSLLVEDKRLVISVKEARKLLGICSGDMSDLDIAKIIHSFTKVSESLLYSSK